MATALYLAGVEFPPQLLPKLVLSKEDGGWGRFGEGGTSTYYGKSVGQLAALLHLLGREVEIVLRPTAATG